MKRRAFLAAGAGLTVTFLSGCALPVIPKRPAPKTADALAWIRFADQRYTLNLPRVEMGQNIATALKQIACIELGVTPDQVALQPHSTRDIAPVRATVGSDSIKDYALPLAQACATLRDALAAGSRAGAIEAEARPAASLRAFKPGAGRVGTAMPIEQAVAIVRGQALYAGDVRRPGMRFGRVLRAPASPELASGLASFNAAAARAVPGFVALVEDRLLTQGNSVGLGIVATTPGALDRIETALAVQWRTQGGFDQADLDRTVDIDRRIARGSLTHRLGRDTVPADGPWDVDLRIDIPLAAHGSIEPRVAVAEPAGKDGMRLWVGSQDAFYQRDVVASRLGFARERVQVQSCRVGGAFGGKTICTVELEAAVLARAVDAPVKVQWSRAQELRLGFHRPPSSHRIRVRLDGQGIADWWHGFASSHILFTNAVLPPWIQRFTDFLGDDGVARGARLPYRASRRRIEFDVVRLPVLTGPWRGLGAGPNVLAIESAIDECARTAKADPVEFRLRNLDDRRLARVLQRAADAAGWHQAPPAAGALRRGRGVACGLYKDMSYAAVVAEVEVADEGAVRVTRMVCAHDCGLVIDADQVRAQCEGNLVWGIGMVFTDRLPAAAGGIAAASFADTPIPRAADVPELRVELVDGGDAPTGTGETAIVASAAAIANAIRDATGVRLTGFPLSSARLGRAKR